MVRCVATPIYQRLSRFSGRAARPAHAARLQLTQLKTVRTIEHVERCFIRQTFRYFAGRPETEADACTLTSMEDAYAEPGSFVEMLIAALPVRHLPLPLGSVPRSRPVTRINRRSLLKGLGAGAGAALFAPLIAQSRAAEASGVLPARVVIFIEGNGLWPRLFRDPKTEAAMRARGAKGTINSSREYAHDVPIVMDRSSPALTPALADAPGLRGLREFGLERRAAVALGLSAKVAGGGHSCENAALSLRRALGGPSIDALLGAEFTRVAGASAAPFDVMRVGVAGGLDERLNY